MELCRRSTYIVVWAADWILCGITDRRDPDELQKSSIICEYHVLYSISISCYSNIEEERGTAAHTDRLYALIGGW